jgi:hypothetical protein
VPYLSGAPSAGAISLQRRPAGVSAGHAPAVLCSWLKREQRVSGRWWMQSLYRGNYQYITYIATCQALKALALCDEIPSLVGPFPPRHRF